MHCDLQRPLHPPDRVSMPDTVQLKRAAAVRGIKILLGQVATHLRVSASQKDSILSRCGGGTLSTDSSAV